MPAVERDRDDAWHLVGVVAVGPGDDRGHQRGAGMEPDAGLRLVVDAPLPAVDRPDRLDTVAAGHEPIFDEASGEVGEPVGVVGGDDDLDAVEGRWRSRYAPGSCSGEVTGSR
jgi:hypothetical protein